MKKFLLVALISSSAIAANAQSSFRNDNTGHDNRPAPATNQHINRQQKPDNRIASVNNDYNNRINNLQRKPFMRAKYRRKQIKQLEKERAVALQQYKDSYSRNYGSANHRHRF